MTGPKDLMARWEGPAAGAARNDGPLPPIRDDSTLVEYRNVGHRYLSRSNPVTSLVDIDLRLNLQEVTVLIGPSGCGKTTLLNLLASFLRPSQGEILLRGGPLGGPGPDRMVVFQEHALFDWMTVYKNILVGLYKSSRSRQQKHERVMELVDFVGLTGFEKRYPRELSGGMRQRAGLARALAPDPQLLLLDEPFGSLDAITRERLQEDLREILSEAQITALLVTHSIDEAVYLGDKVCVMTPRPGRIDQVWHNPLDRSNRIRTDPGYAEAVNTLRGVFDAIVVDGSRDDHYAGRA